MSKEKEAGHRFLARLGKTRLRPGGRKATDWLIGRGGFTADTKVLEVACNMCTTAVELASRFGCEIHGVDLDKDALAKGERNIQTAGLTDKIHIQFANAAELPFPDNSFDVVLNEAMLTMLPLEAKQKAVSEYFRVLKPNGILLTHDVMLVGDDTGETLENLRNTINVKVTPLPKNEWLALFQNSGFGNIQSYDDKMTLLSPGGMIHDEGISGTLKILKNALSRDNFPQFEKMFKTFNDPKHPLNFIAVCSRKPA